MKHAELGKNFKVFLSDTEMERFRRLVSSRGAKMAPLTRQLILREMDSVEAIEDGKTQVNISAFRSPVTQEELEPQS